MNEQVIAVTEPRAMLLAVRVLCTGGIVVLPTDTLYGLHGMAGPMEMAPRLAELKGHPDGDRGFILLTDSLARVERYAVLEDEERQVLERLCPGPVSFILDALPETPDDWVAESQGRRRVAFRIPDYSFLISLIELLDAPLMSTSANPAGEAPLESVSDIVKIFGDKVDAIIADPELENRIAKEGLHPSALVDFTCRPPALLREGRQALDLSMKASSG